MLYIKKILPSEAEMGGKIGEGTLEGIESEDEPSEDSSLIFGFIMVEDKESVLSFTDEFNIVFGCPAILNQNVRLQN